MLAPKFCSSQQLKNSLVPRKSEEEMFYDDYYASIQHGANQKEKKIVSFLSFKEKYKNLTNNFDIILGFTA
jgi:hypothetical protein